MGEKTIEMLVSSDRLVLRTRQWDGIDRPEYEDIGISLSRARQLAAELPALIEQAAGNAADKRRLQADELRRKIDTLETDLARLKAQEEKESRHDP